MVIRVNARGVWMSEFVYICLLAYHQYVELRVALALGLLGVIYLVLS